MSQAHLHLSPSAIYPFDARGIAKRFRHAAIFGATKPAKRKPGDVKAGVRAFVRRKHARS